MNWNGAFAFKKSIGTVRFVPLLAMTARDWAWLDYDNTRLVAQNRIASMAINGKLSGFFQVLIAQKVKSGKNEYFWPADESMYSDFESADEVTALPDGTLQGIPSNGTAAGSPVQFFGNDPDEETYSNAAREFDSVTNRISALGRAATFLLFAGVVGLAIKEHEDQEQVDAFNYLMSEYIRTGEANLVIAAAIVAMRFMSLGQVNILLDEIVSLEEFDDGSNQTVIDEQAMQIWDYLNSHRQQIAAGRGLT